MQSCVFSSQFDVLIQDSRNGAMLLIKSNSRPPWKMDVLPWEKFPIHLAFEHQSPLCSIWAFRSVVDAVLDLDAQIGMQSVVLLLCRKCAKFD